MENENGYAESRPVFENDILRERIRTIPQKGFWVCASRRFPLTGDAEWKAENAAILLAAVRENGERVLTLSTADDGCYRDLLFSFAREVACHPPCPKEIRAEDSFCLSLLDDFCRKTGIYLIQEHEPKVLKDIEWLIEKPASREESGQTDSFFCILLRLRDEEFSRMPRDLAERLLSMYEKGFAPEALARRIRSLCLK